jgi:hypothetical protein
MFYISYKKIYIAIYMCFIDYANALNVDNTFMYEEYKIYIWSIKLYIESKWYMYGQYTICLGQYALQK